MKNLFFILLLSVVFASCNGGGLLALPFLIAVAGVYFLGVAYRKSKSGSDQQTPGGIVDSEKNVAIYKIGQFYYGCALLIAALFIAIAINNDYRPYDPKKDGVPKEAPKDNKMSAEEQQRIADSILNLKK